MKTSFVSTLLLSACVVFATSNANAQQQTTQQQQQTTQQLQQTNQQEAAQAANAAAAQPQVVKKVGFRMANWRTIHGDGTKATTIW